MNYQVVGVGGHVVADAKGTEKVVNFTLAVNSGYGEKERTAFINCVVFKGSQSEKLWNAITGLKKGSSVGVKGEFYTDSWEKDGKKQSMLKLVVSNLNFGPRPDGAKSKAKDDTKESKSAKSEAPASQEDDNIPF